MENDGDRHDDRKFIERVNNITLLASKSFHSLNVSNRWNIPYNHQHGMAKRKYIFDNFGGEHYSPDFPHPCDETKIKKAEEEHADRRVGGGNNGGRNGGHGSERVGGSQVDRKKWSNDNKYGDRNDYGNGVQNRGMLRCDISVVRSVDGITPILLDFMPLVIVIL